MTIVECIAVLLHQHDKTVKNDENGMCPRPISIDHPLNNCTEKHCLPDL